MKKTVKIKDIYNLFQKYGDLNIRVNTPYGYKKIENCDITEKNSNVVNISTDNFSLNCSPHHLIKTKNGRFKEAILLNPSQKIKTKRGNERINTLELLTYKKDLYDIQVNDVEQYYSNGIVSHNSNFLESLCFTIFDKSPRTLKSENAMNNKKNSFHARFLYDIGTDEFRIKRDGVRKKTGEVIVKTDFSVKDSNGERKSLNGERRSSTNFVIRNYLGDYDSFVMTALVPQIDLHRGTNASLINMRQTDRKSLLTRFLDLTVFQELYDLARDEMKVVEIRLQEFEKREFSKELAYTNIQLKVLTNTYKEKNDKKSNYDTLYKNINNEIKKLTSKLIKIDIGETDINILEADKKKHEKQIENIKKILFEHESKIDELIKETDNISNDLNNIDEDIINRYRLVTDIEKQRDDAQHNIDKYQIKIDTKRNQLGDFSKLIFDTSCEMCVGNKKFIEEKMETEDDILENETILQTFKQQFQNFAQMLYQSKDIHEEYKLFLTLKEKLNDRNNMLSLAQTHKIADERMYDNLKRSLVDVDNNIDLYHKNKKTIEKNKEIQIIIDEWERKLTVVEDGISKITKEIMEIYSNIELNKNRKQQIEKEIEEVKNLEIQLVAYRYYTEAVEKDGVTFDLIVKTMPLIQHEVNNILAQMVDFQVMFNIDEMGKDIELKIMYDDGNIWPIELSSGFERFVADIAIRIALLSVSSLPRPNFIVVDEGFGSLDSDNANNLYRLFDYLRLQFEFVIVVSHLDWIKDMADSIIEIKWQNGFSKIINN